MISNYKTVLDVIFKKEYVYKRGFLYKFFLHKDFITIYSNGISVKYVGQIMSN